jgi:hypothetical protein
LALEVGKRKKSPGPQDRKQRLNVRDFCHLPGKKAGKIRKRRNDE